MKLNNIQSESELTEDASITNTVMAQHKSIWSAEREDQLVECLYGMSCKTFILKSPEILRAFTVRTLVEHLLVCVVLSSSHRSTPHTIGAKRFILLSSCVCVVSHILKIV